MIAATENRIEQLAAQLQRLPPNFRWVFGNQSLVQARAQGIEPKRGPWERRAKRLIGAAERVGLARPLTKTVNLMLLFAVYAGQFRVRVAMGRPAPLFMGIRALREPGLVQRFAKMQGRPVVYIDERNPNDFYRHGRLPLAALLREVIQVWRELSQAFHSQQWPEVFETSDLLAFVMMRGHRFAYLRAWFKRYLRTPGASSTIACTPASYVSYAAVAAGAEAVYMLHGFQRHSIVYAEFSKCECFDSFDAAHVQRRLPRCAVKIVPEPMRRIETRRVAAVAGILWDDPDGFDRIRPFIEWALRNEMSVIVRKHPFDSSDYWQQWRETPGVEIAEGGDSFEHFLESVRPCLLASWYSTVLFDALVMGIVPVTVSPAGGETLDTVFPVRSVSLCWPEHEAIAQSLIDDGRARAEFLAEKYASVVGLEQGSHASAPVAPAV